MDNHSPTATIDATTDPRGEVNTPTRPRACLAELLGTLDELAAAARSGDATRYDAALRLAERQGLTDEQVRDAYWWGTRRQGAAAFTWQGSAAPQAPA